MARHQNLLKISPIVIAAIAIALFSHQLIDESPDYSQLANPVPWAEQAGENKVHSPYTPPRSDELKLQSGITQKSTIDAQAGTSDSQNVTATIDSITLSGRVATEFGGNIAGETVVLFSSYLRVHYSIVTNYSGEFIFPELKPSYDYTLKVSPRGLYKRHKEFPIKLSATQEVHNIILEPIPLGMLSGRIADPYGQPVGGIKVNFKTIEIDAWSTDVVTDSNGNFSVVEFPQGNFELMIKGAQSVTARGLIFDPDAGEHFNLIIDIGPYHLTGRIYDDSGQTPDGANVFLNWALQQDGIRVRSTRQVSADASGEFQFPGLGPGNHELVVTAWWDDGFGQTIKQTIRQTVNVGNDPAEMNIFFSTS